MLTLYILLYTICIRDMDQPKVERYCRKYEVLLKDMGRDIPIGGIVTENFYIYPFKKDHLLEFKYGSGTSSSILNIGISIYRRLYGNAIKREPYPWDDGVCKKLDYISCKAMEDLGGENATGLIKEGEEYSVLSLFRNDWINDFRAREVTNLFVTKIEDRLKDEEIYRMYL